MTAVRGRIVRPGAVVSGHVEIDGPTIIAVTDHAHDIAHPLPG